MRASTFLFALAIMVVPAAANAADEGLAGSHDLRKEAGKLCMSEHGHSGSGTGASKEAARRAAIVSWNEFTTFEYGRAWGSYANSAGQKTSYTKEASGWSATVESRPCRR